MIDMFALAVSHGLILLGLWRMVNRADLDGELPEKSGKETPPRA